MRGRTLLLTSEAALVAAMLERMGWVHWLAAIHAALCIGLVVGAVIIFVLICAGIFIGLPCLLLVGVGKAVVWLFRPVTFGDPA